VAASPFKASCAQQHPHSKNREKNYEQFCLILQALQLMKSTRHFLWSSKRELSV